MFKKKFKYLLVTLFVLITCFGCRQEPENRNSFKVNLIPFSIPYLSIRSKPTPSLSITLWKVRRLMELFQVKLRLANIVLQK